MKRPGLETHCGNHAQVFRRARFARILVLACALGSCSTAPEQSSLVKSCPAAPQPDGPSRIREVCTEDAVCPAGTACLSGVLPCDGGSDCACRPQYYRSAQTDQLVQGFRATEFDLRVTPGQPSSFSWTQPNYAVDVVCGLFVADPQVTGGPLGHIRNASQALHRTHTFRISASQLGPQSVSFTVADLSTPHVPDSCEAATRLQPVEPADTPYPIVSALRLACWATDTSGVIAATRLQDVSLTDVPEVNAPISDCASLGEEFDGRYCYPAPQTGLCHAGTCQPLPLGMPATDASAPSLGEAGADGTGQGSPADSQAPVASCAPQLDGVLCKRTPDFEFGRCIAGHCSPATQAITALDLPLVVASCAPQKDLSATTDWLNCFDRDLQGFGTCLDGDCRQRCLNSEDCTSSSPDNPSAAYTCLKQGPGQSRVCSGTPAANQSILGLCVLSTEAACN